MNNREPKKTLDFISKHFIYHSPSKTEDDDRDDVIQFFKLIQSLTDFPAASEICKLISQYFYFHIQAGTHLDVKGISANIDMFHDTSNRWDVSRVLSYKKSTNQVHLQPIARTHPYPYLYHPYPPAFPIKTLDLDPEVIQPVLSKVEVKKPTDCKESDLIDVKQNDGTWRVAEVTANIGCSLWVLYVDDYKTSEFKNSLREWVAIRSDRLAPYHSQTLVGSLTNKQEEQPEPPCLSLGRLAKAASI